MRPVTAPASCPQISHLQRTALCTPRLLVDTPREHVLEDKQAYEEELANMRRPAVQMKPISEMKCVLWRAGCCRGSRCDVSLTIAPQQHLDFLSVVPLQEQASTAQEESSCD